MHWGIGNELKELSLDGGMDHAAAGLHERVWMFTGVLALSDLMVLDFMKNILSQSSFQGQRVRCAIEIHLGNVRVGIPMINGLCQFVDEVRFHVANLTIYQDAWNRWPRHSLDKAVPCTTSH